MMFAATERTMVMVLLLTTSSTRKEHCRQRWKVLHLLHAQKEAHLLLRVQRGC